MVLQFPDMCCRQNPQQSLAHTAKHVAVLQAPDKGISPEMVMQFLAWNAEAAGRCGVLSPAGAAPAKRPLSLPLLHSAPRQLRLPARNRLAP